MSRRLFHDVRGRVGVVVLLLATLATLSGCTPYAVRGMVVSGAAPTVQWVTPDDPRLDGLGLASARVVAWLDPDRLSPEKVGEVTSDGAGRFALPIDASGAGLLMMDVEVRGERPPDHGSATAELELPHRGQLLLITLKPGPDTAPRPAGNVLDQTLQDAAPFLNN